MKFKCIIPLFKIILLRLPYTFYHFTIAHSHPHIDSRHHCPHRWREASTYYTQYNSKNNETTDDRKMHGQININNKLCTSRRSWTKWKILLFIMWCVCGENLQFILFNFNWIEVFWVGPAKYETILIFSVFFVARAIQHIFLEKPNNRSGFPLLDWTLHGFIFSIKIKQHPFELRSFVWFMIE